MVQVVQVVLKWSKEVIEFEIEVPTTPNSFTGRSFKDTVHSLTKVPVDRQKIVVAKTKSKPTPSGTGKTKNPIKWWKGILKDDFDFASAIVASINTDNSTRIELRLTLMGTAEVLESNSNREKTKFIEDMSLSEKKEAEQREWMNSMENVAAMIPALQVPPLDRQPPGNTNGDGSGNSSGDPMQLSPPTIVSEFTESRAYDRLVHGYSQLRIDALLREQTRGDLPGADAEEPGSLSTPRLHGRPVMTMGLELQRAYVNDLAVLKDGTLVSALDDGHVQLWKHCRRICDIVHKPGQFGGSQFFSGVDSVLALDDSNSPSSPFAFCTAGMGTVRVWDSDGDALLGLVPSPLPNTSPTGLVRIPTNSPDALCLAARFRIAWPASRRPRLVPQDEAGRRRLIEIERSEAEMNDALTGMSKTVQVFFSDGGSKTQGVKNFFLTAPAPVTALASWKQGNDSILAVGDNQGGITLQKIATTEPGSNGRQANISNNKNNSTLRIQELRRIQFASSENASETRSSIVYLQYMAETKQLLVSTKEIQLTALTNPSSNNPILTLIPSAGPQAVHSIDMEAVLSDATPRPLSSNPLLFSLAGHKDEVHCIMSLPNGDLLTAGGKHDATTQIWSRSQLQSATTRTETPASEPILAKAATVNLCKDAGYIFAAEVLEDFKSKGDSSGDEPNNKKEQKSSPFAIAVARYNVVKIIV